jgi:hypothetical protein
MFSEGYAFSSLMVHELRRKGFSLVPNSSEEILEATKEIIENINESKKEPSSFRGKVNLIRERFNSPTWGDFSESYISRNPRWLDLE